MAEFDFSLAELYVYGWLCLGDLDLAELYIGCLGSGWPVQCILYVEDLAVAELFNIWLGAGWTVYWVT